MCIIRPPCLLVLSRESWHWYVYFSKNAVIKNTVRWKTDELEEYTGMQFAESVSVVQVYV